MKSLPLRKWNCPDVWVNLETRRLGMPHICAQRWIGVRGTLAWILHSRPSTTPLPLRQARWRLLEFVSASIHPCSRRLSISIVSILTLSSLYSTGIRTLDRQYGTHTPRPCTLKGNQIWLDHLAVRQPVHALPPSCTQSAGTRFHHYGVLPHALQFSWRVGFDLPFLNATRAQSSKVPSLYGVHTH